MLRTLLAAAVAGVALVAPAASAESVCVPVPNGGGDACVTVTADTEGTPGLAVEAGPLCLVVLASC